MCKGTVVGKGAASEPLSLPLGPGLWSVSIPWDTRSSSFAASQPQRLPLTWRIQGKPLSVT